MNADKITTHLESTATDDVARATSKQVRSLKGIRGTPAVEIARVLASSWRSSPARLPQDEDALTELFGMAWEDGLVAVGLLAAATPDAPGDALEIARDWLDRTDDLQTADALGWLVIGPAALAGQVDLEALFDELARTDDAIARRAAVMAGMAMTTTRIEGPSAAALRERIGAKDVRFVDQALSDRLKIVADRFLRDEDAHVRKALRRVLAAWAVDDPEAATTWMEEFRGGVPKMIREEVERAARKGRRLARVEEPE